MGRLIAELVPMGIAGAVSPVSVSLLILVLTGRRSPLRNGALLVVGYVGALVVAGVAVLVAFHPSVGTDGHSTERSTIDILIGALLLLLAVRRLLKAPSDSAAPPKWMESLDTMAPVRAVVIGAGLLVVNFTTVAIYIPALAEIAKAGLGFSSSAIALAVVIALISSTMTAPVVLYAVMRQRAGAILNALRSWLAKHDRAVMTVVLVVFGLYLLLKGLLGLS